MSTDLKFYTPEGRFHYRVGAIILHKGKALIIRNNVAPYCYSVGGKVHYNESTAEAVVREVEEETGIRMEIDRPVFFHEQFFDEEVTGEHCHEIAVFYLMKDCDDLDHVACHSETERGEIEELVWMDPATLAEHGFVPASIGRGIAHLPDSMCVNVEIDRR